MNLIQKKYEKETLRVEAIDMLKHIIAAGDLTMYDVLISNNPGEKEKYIKAFWDIAKAWKITVYELACIYRIAKIGGIAEGKNKDGKDN